MNDQTALKKVLEMSYDCDESNEIKIVEFLKYYDETRIDIVKTIYKECLLVSSEG